MTMHQSNPGSPLLPDLRTITPCTPVPVPTGLVRDAFEVRITTDASEDGTLERDPRGLWVGRLRRLGAAKLRSSGLESLVHDAVLLISEIATNALRYGSDEEEIAFQLIITSAQVLIAVNDGSPHRPELNLVGADSTNGRGLFLVASIAGDWGVSPDGTTTWCVVNAPTTTR